jgi:uncharacterized protein
MNIFEEQLSQGKFVIPECSSCKEIVWPPSDFCNQFEGIGKILEYSKKDEEFFCLAEFEKKIRIMGKLETKSGTPEVGKMAKLDSCRIVDKNYSFTMKLQ